ncbi:MAG: TonB-dependent receptor [Acidobacteria bacterium]|nr:TonB-dependent receptor [Acidobacteriota bacterium]
MKFPQILAVLFIVCLMLLPDSVWAQATAQISGTVGDQSGAILPGVKITATQIDTGASRSTITNNTGFYVLPNLPLGPYRLEASLAGFRTFAQTGIVLQVGSNPVINLHMEVGQLEQTVEVKAEATSIETRSLGVGTVIETQRVLDLPLNGREVTDLITLSGLSVQTGRAPGYTMDTGVNISVAGGTSYGVQYNLDGAAHLDMYVGTNMPLPFPDALQEFKVVASSQDASSGGHAAATVNSVTKSGTNEFHGDLFWFLRNAAFNSRDAFAADNDQLKRNQFGGVLGGPLKKNKVFVFAGFQGTTTRQTPSNLIAYVPTAAMRSGDFSEYLSPANGCPSASAIKSIVDSNGKLTFPLSPAAVNISSRLPQTSDPCGKVASGNPVHENRYQIPARLDIQLSERHSLFARYLATKIDAMNPYEIRKNDVLATSGWCADDLAQSLAFGSTDMLGPNIVNSFRISGNRVAQSKIPAKFFEPSDVGINNMYSYIPDFTAALVTGAFMVGFPANLATSTSAMTNFGVNEDVTVVKGSHQLAFGGSVGRGLLFARSYAWAPGVMIFAGLPNLNPMLGIPPGAPPVLGTGAAITDFLTGKLTQLHQANPNPENLTQNYFALYLQDTWKLSRRLTLNYGLRWAPFMPMQFRDGNVYNFSLENFYNGVQSTVIPTAPPGFSYPGDPGFHGNSGMDSQWGNLEPRIGIAWDPAGDGKMVVRLGGGIAHDFVRMDLHQNTSTVAPFRLTVYTPAGANLDNPYPAGNPFPYEFDPNNPVWPSTPDYQGFYPIPSNLKTTVQYSWNLGIQRQVTKALFVSATYAGSHLIHTWTAIELNPGMFIPGDCVPGQYGLYAPGPCTQSTNINQRRLLNLTNPGAPNVNTLGSMTQLDDGGTQSYHGFLLNARLKLGERLSLDGNYTWSHCIGLPITTVLNLGGTYPHGPYQNNGPNDRRLDFGDCSGSDMLTFINLLDIRQAANVSFVASTPKYSGGSWLKRIASSWNFSTIFQIHSGQPLMPMIGSDQAYNGLGFGQAAIPVPQRPNQVLPNVAASDRGQSCMPGPCVSWFNPAAMALPAAGTYGNMGVGSLRGPGFWEWDQSMSRKFQISEGHQIEFRAEAFNVTNSLRLGNPDTNLSSGNFGKITASANPSGIMTGNNGGRVMQFALKYIF